MILIADSGSTKTDWRLLSDNSVKAFHTIGFNPYFVSAQDIAMSIKQSELSNYIQKIKTVYFFGAGCSAKDQCLLISNTLSGIFTNSVINVDSDMAGACKSLFGNETGIAAILGTGSNSAFYKSGKLVYSQPSLGYVLGDEGSGSYLGKQLISSYLRNELPDELARIFNQRFHLSKREILFSVYKGKFPNRYLASFSVFLYEHITHEFVADIVEKSIEDFFVFNLLKYPEVKENVIRFTGSVSYYFADIIKKLGKKYELEIDKIEKQPIEGLVKYFS